MMSAKDCLQIGCNNCQFCEPGPTVSVFKPGCPFYVAISKGQSKPYTGGDTMPPYPVMHGSMYTEVQTLEMCYNTKCTDCAFTLHRIDEKLPISKANCNHKTTMYFIVADDMNLSYPDKEIPHTSQDIIITSDNRRLWPFIIVGNKIIEAVTHPFRWTKQTLTDFKRFMVEDFEYHTEKIFDRLITYVLWMCVFMMFGVVILITSLFLELV